MKVLHAVLLMPEEPGERLCRMASAAGILLRARVVADQAGLAEAFLNPPQLLLSFGTSVIVPAHMLDLPQLLALNVHAASPDYPGRDPHHFAIYDGATRYGATMHLMTAKVDAGPIVDVELFDVAPDATPSSLLDRANHAAWVLLERLLRKLASDQTPVPLTTPRWGSRKTTRSMFLELCRVDASMSEMEFARRLHATSMPGYDNLYLELHGYRFRFEGKS